MVEVAEKGKLTRKWVINRFANKEDAATRKQYSDEEVVRHFGIAQETHIDGNLLLNEGINELWTILCSTASGTKFSNANAYLGVGDSSTAESASQTGLQAATNKLYVAMDTSYPTFGTLQKATWKSTFTETQANFAWNEFTVANGSSDSAVNLNRKVSAQSTKVSGQVWELSLVITLS